MTVPVVFWLKLLGLFSLCAFIGTLAAIPWLVGRMRADYFVTRRQQRERRIRSLGGVAAFVTRNILGAGLLFMGFLMLFLPGQGLLTLLIGFCLMDFPGKDRLINRLVRNPGIQRALNWIRRKRGKEEFVFLDGEA